MATSPIRFEDGAAYERGMGGWSRIAGEIFLDWLAPQAGLRWIDVGCGSGAVTELLMQRCAPAEAHGIDPSEAQLAFARQRPGARGATFQLGDAMALPFPENRFDAAVMALVIFFVPDPAKGLAEMARVVSPGGTVAAYAWDMASGGFPFAPIHAELRASGHMLPQPPSIDASRMDAMHALWTGAGLEAVEVREIAPRRTFASFDEFWTMSTGTGSVRPALAALTPEEAQRLKEQVRARLPADSEGRISYAARANAIKGRVPR
ncbi:MAG TPA: methyltransferase domain-containing protein [Acetobacteraceae bacterium]|jgi:SAM-dependent methyltransferase